MTRSLTDEQMAQLFPYRCHICAKPQMFEISIKAHLSVDHTWRERAGLALASVVVTMRHRGQTFSEVSTRQASESADKKVPMGPIRARVPSFPRSVYPLSKSIQEWE